MSAIRALRLGAPAVMLASVIGLRGACAQSADEQAVMAANTAFYNIPRSARATRRRWPKSTRTKTSS
jgi:hypothetical protein